MLNSKITMFSCSIPIKSPCFLGQFQNHHVFLVNSKITMFSWSIPKSPCFLGQFQNHHVFLLNSKITMFSWSIPKSPCFLGQFQNHHVFLVNSHKITFCLVTSHKRTTSPDSGSHISRTPKLPSRQPGGWHHPRRSRNSYVLGTSWDILGIYGKMLWENAMKMLWENSMFETTNQ